MQLNDLKISRELFIETLEAIQKGLEQRDQVDKALSQFSDSFVITNIGDDWLNALVKLLEDAVGDEVSPKYGSTITWWLYENVVPKSIYLQSMHPKNRLGKELEIPVETPEQLYDYFLIYR
jgi:hypothetical protein